jgi:simple sugar transport system permease protein
MSELLESGIVLAILASMIRISTPLLLASIGELVVQRSGIWNLGIEGTMLVGAFASYMTAITTDSLMAAVAVAVLSGILMNMIMGVCAVSFKLNQFIVGLGMNLLGAGLTLFFYREAAAAAGGETLPTVRTFDPIRIAGFSEIPIIGQVLFTQQTITYLAFALVPLVWWFLYRTKFGLEIRSLGENPKALDVKGMSISIRQYLALAFGGALTGLAGSYLVLALTDRFVPGMTAGRGWLAFVIIIAGKWRPFPILAAVLVFALIEAFQLQAQGIGVTVPYQLLLALPYLVAIVALVAMRNKSEQPERLGVPYRRE